MKEVKGVYVSDNSRISSTSVDTEDINKNIFKTKEQALASLALAQLSQLREVYRQGWEPDWNSDNGYKWCILFKRNNVEIDVWNFNNHFLSFQTKKIAEEFLNNFKDLIIQARPLMS